MLGLICYKTLWYQRPTHHEIGHCKLVSTYMSTYLNLRSHCLLLLSQLATQPQMSLIGRLDLHASSPSNGCRVDIELFLHTCLLEGIFQHKKDFLQNTFLKTNTI